MGWGRPAPLRCELNLLGRSYGAGWVNKESLQGQLAAKRRGRVVDGEDSGRQPRIERNSSTQLRPMSFECSAHATDAQQTSYAC